MILEGTNISIIVCLVIFSSLGCLILTGSQYVFSINSNVTFANSTEATVKLSEVPAKNNSIPTENQEVVNFTEKFLSPHLVKVTDGVYSAVGYGPANIMMIEGNDGLIIIDSGSSVDQAKDTLSAFRKISNKTIVALIYTSAQADRIGGGGVFVNDSAGRHVDVLAQDSFIDNYFSSLGATSRQKSMYNVFLTGLLLQKDGSDRVINNGVGPNWKLGNISFVMPNVLFNDTLKVRYGGINLTLAYAPGVSDDQLVVWLPEKKVLFSGDNVYEAFPSLYSMNNGNYRDVEQWLDVIEAMNDVNASFLVPSHLMPVIGSENVTNVLTSYRDGMAFIYQQTVRYINQGFSPGEIVQILQLPSSLKAHPWLQERSGEIAWQIRAIYDALVGWNTGDATWFNQVSSDERARKIVEAYGGLNQTVTKIKDVIKNGEYTWAAELATYALDAHPDSKEARSLKAQALRIMGWQNPTSEGRNWYLTQANILDRKINMSTVENLPNVNIGEILDTVPLKKLLAQMQYKLNPDRASNMTLTLGIYLNDTRQGYTLTIRNNAVQFLDSFPEEYDVALSSHSDTMKDILLGKLKLADAIFSNDVKVDGNLKDLIRFVRSFDLRFVVPAYNNLAG